jgi:hypothetical protein
MADLITRLGRAAYANPAWTPAWADRAPPREADSLAPDRQTLTSALAAVHHAADMLARLTTATRDDVRAAAENRQLVIPTRLLPEHIDHPRAYAPAFREQVSTVLDAYQHATAATAEAAASLDAATMTLNAPSRVLTTARSAIWRWHQATGIHDISQTSAANSPPQMLPAWKLAFPYPPGTPDDIQTVEENFRRMGQRPGKCNSPTQSPPPPGQWRLASRRVSIRWVPYTYTKPRTPITRYVSMVGSLCSSGTELPVLTLRS